MNAKTTKKCNVCSKRTCNCTLLQRAISAGIDVRQEEQRIELDRKRAQAAKDAALLKEAEEYALERLLKDDYVFNLIKEATRKGEKKTYIPRSGIAVYNVLRREAVFKGITAAYSSGYAHINSDEIEEFWESVEISW